jgi:hypothetical protein
MQENEGDTPRQAMVDECLPHGLSRLFDDVQEATNRIVDLEFGKSDSEAS